MSFEVVNDQISLVKLLWRFWTISGWISGSREASFHLILLEGDLLVRSKVFAIYAAWMKKSTLWNKKFFSPSADCCHRWSVDNQCAFYIGLKMNSLLIVHLGLFLLLLIGSAGGQEVGQECLANFKSGREDFVLDADDSVKDGATFISSPKLNRYKDCLVACCKEPKCNVAFMEKADEEGFVKSCFLFDCLYKKKYACHFVRRTGYINYIMDSVYEGYLAVDAPTGKLLKISFKLNIICTEGNKIKRSEKLWVCEKTT